MEAADEFKGEASVANRNADIHISLLPHAAITPALCLSLSAPAVNMSPAIL
jgi:hypothetical protein